MTQCEHQSWRYQVYLEILLEGIGELFAVFHKLSFPLLQRVLALSPWDVGRHLVDGVQQLLDGTCYLLDSLQEGLAVGDLIRDPREDLLEVGRLPVQLLERLFCSRAAVFQRVLVTYLQQNSKVRKAPVLFQDKGEPYPSLQSQH